MSKLDWSRVGIVHADPARVQQVVDFSTPDKPRVGRFAGRAKAKKSPKITAQGQKLAALISVARAIDLQRGAGYRALHRAAEKLKRAAEQQAAKQKAEKKEQARQKHRHEVAIQQAAELARRQTPEYLAAQKIEEERIAAAELERRDALRREREPLRQQWREKLLNKPDTSLVQPSPIPSGSR